MGLTMHEKKQPVPPNAAVLNFITWGVNL